MTTCTSTVPTPVGDLRLAVDVGPEGERLVVLAFADHFDRVAAPVRRRRPEDWTEAETRATDVVRRYVAGEDLLAPVSPDQGY